MAFFVSDWIEWHKANEIIASRYLDETLNADPVIRATAMQLTGNHNDAGKIKAGIHSAAVKSYQAILKKYFREYEKKPDYHSIRLIDLPVFAGVNYRNGNFNMSYSDMEFPEPTWALPARITPSIPLPAYLDMAGVR